MKRSLLTTIAGRIPLILVTSELALSEGPPLTPLVLSNPWERSQYSFCAEVFMPEYFSQLAIIPP